METKDEYKNHFAHDTYEAQCSDCYRERRIINAKRTVDRESLGTSIGHERSSINDPRANENPLG